MLMQGNFQTVKKNNNCQTQLMEYVEMLHYFCILAVAKLTSQFFFLLYSHFDMHLDASSYI